MPCCWLRARKCSKWNTSFEIRGVILLGTLGFYSVAYFHEGSKSVLVFPFCEDVIVLGWYRYWAQDRSKLVCDTWWKHSAFLTRNKQTKKKKKKKLSHFGVFFCLWAHWLEANHLGCFDFPVFVVWFGIEHWYCATAFSYPIQPLLHCLICPLQRHKIIISSRIILSFILMDVPKQWKPGGEEMV